MNKPTIVIVTLSLVLAGKHILNRKIGKPVNRENAQSTTLPVLVEMHKEKDNLRLKKAPLSCNDGCKLNLSIKIKQVCHVGDFNLIKAAVLNQKAKPEVLLSIESLVPIAHEPIYSQRILYSELEKSVDFKASLGKFLAPGLYGIFICKDSNGDGKCGTKAAKDFDAIQMEIFSNMKDPSRPISDSVFFFQSFIWDKKEELSLLHDPNVASLSDEIYSSRTEYLKTLRPDYSAVEEGVSRALRWSRLLRSIPLELGDSKATIILPYRKPGDPSCLR